MRHTKLLHLISNLIITQFYILMYCIYHILAENKKEMNLAKVTSKNTLIRCSCARNIKNLRYSVVAIC